MVPKFSKILVVTDFSDTASRALPYAFAIASAGAEVYLVHVIEHPPIANPLYSHYSADSLFDPEAQRQAIAKVEANLKALVPQEAAAKGIVTKVAGVIHRSVSEGIATEAQQRGCDVIVIGSHGRTGLANLMLGSVAEGVIRRATVPVLIVPMRGG